MKTYTIVLFFLLSSFLAFAKNEKAIFAGGCFWCMEPPYEKLAGVMEVRSGYTGGKQENPSYEDVTAGGSGHVEAVEVTYDPTKVTYATLLDIFWKNIDPLDNKGQFCDKGDSYRSGLFPLNDEQKVAAKNSLQKLQNEKFKEEKIATFIRDAGTFWPAEEKHQDYYKKNSTRYKFYRWKCGRDKRLKELWND